MGVGGGKHDGVSIYQYSQLSISQTLIFQQIHGYQRICFGKVTHFLFSFQLLLSQTTDISKVNFLGLGPRKLTLRYQ